MEVNGWRLYAYEAFLDQLKTLINQVEAFQEKDPKGFVSKKETKLLGAINKLILEEIPSEICFFDYFKTRKITLISLY